MKYYKKYLWIKATKNYENFYEYAHDRLFMVSNSYVILSVIISFSFFLFYI
jgi:hypothetical protein